MKKIILLLAFIFTLSGQAQAVFDEGIQVTNTTDNSAAKVNVQNALGVINTIAKSDLIEVLEYSSAATLPATGLAGKIYVTIDTQKQYRWTGSIYSEYYSGKEDKTNKVSTLTGYSEILYPNEKAVHDEIDVLTHSRATGLSQGGLMTINSTASLFDFASGYGYIINGHSDPENPTVTKVTWVAKIGNSVPNIATQKQTYVAVDINGDLFFTNSPLTATQRRNYIRIGVLIHLDNSTIGYIDNQPTVNIEVGAQVQDILNFLGFKSISGNRIFPVGANLKIKKELGTAFKQGSNFNNLVTQPHSFVLDAIDPISFKYRTQTGVEGSFVTDINPAIYDLNGAFTAMPATATLATIQKIYVFQDNSIRIQPGQKYFDNLGQAIDAINSDVFITDSDIANNGLPLGSIVLIRGTTALNTLAQAIFVPSAGVSTNGSVSTPALGYVAEDKANKQNSLVTDGTGAKYLTVDAAITGLALKANANDAALTGTPTAPTPSGSNTAQVANVAYVLANAGSGSIGGSGTAGTIPKFTAANTLGNSVITELANGNVGFNRANPQSRLDVDGSLRFAFNAVGDGLYGVSSFGNEIMSFTRQNTPPNAMALNTYGTFGIKTGNTTGASKTDYNFSISAAGYTLINTNSNNGRDFLQVNGNIKADPATFSDQVIVKSQHDLKANIDSPTFTNAALIAANALGSTSNYFGQTMATNDSWRIYGADGGENKGIMVFETGDDGIPFSSANGQKFEFRYKVRSSGAGTDKTPLTIDYNEITALANVTATSFVKSGATATNILLAGGTDIAQSTFAPSTGSVNYIQNQSAVAQNASLSINSGRFGDNLFANDIFGQNFSNSVSSGAITIAGGATSRGGEIILAGGSNGGNIVFKTGISTGVQPTALTLASNSAATFTSSVTATSHVTTGGLASQNVRGNGSLSVGYKVYAALLTQSGTSAPVATVLENTLGGTVVWTRSSTGIYIGTLSGVFTLNKTHCTGTPSTHPSLLALDSNSVNSFSVATEDSSGVLFDSYLVKTPIEIRVYN
jgi:hypothetical protein